MGEDFRGMADLLEADQPDANLGGVVY